MDTSKAEALPGVKARAALRRPRAGRPPGHLLRVDQRQQRLARPDVLPQHQGPQDPRLHGPLGGRRSGRGGGGRERGHRRRGAPTWWRSSGRQLPFVLDQYEAIKPEAPVIHPGHQARPTTSSPPTSSAAGTCSSTRATLWPPWPRPTWWSRPPASITGRTTPLSIPRGCLVTWEGDKLTCWNNYYAPDQTRMYISQMTGLPLKRSG